MNINLTLLGQMITFALFVWFTMKFVWPPVMKAMNDRQKKVADGLAAAERGHHNLEAAQQKIVEQFKDAKTQANEIIEKANKRAGQIIEEAKVQARKDEQRFIAVSRASVESELIQVKRALQQQVADIAIAGVEKIIAKQVDLKEHQKLMNDLIDGLK